MKLVPDTDADVPPAPALKRLLHVVDSLVTMFVVGPLAVLHWRGAWALMDRCPGVFSPGNSVAMAMLVLCTIAMMREFLFEQCSRRPPPPSADGKAPPNSRSERLARHVLKKVYTYVFGLGCNMQWRGSWALLDAHFGEYIRSAGPTRARAAGADLTCCCVVVARHHLRDGPLGDWSVLRGLVAAEERAQSGGAARRDTERQQGHFVSVSDALPHKGECIRQCIVGRDYRGHYFSVATRLSVIVSAQHSLTYIVRAIIRLGFCTQLPGITELLGLARDECEIRLLCVRVQRPLSHVTLDVSEIL